MNRNARVSSGVLQPIVERKREEVAGLRRRAATLRTAASGAPAPRSLREGLRCGGIVRLLAEVKRRSPSAGWIRKGGDAVVIARAYEAAGAAAVSVLTDGPSFGGSLGDLEGVRGAIALPVLRKDFTVDALQLWEARAAGADAVLLIVRILDDALLTDLLATAAGLGMDALVEVHDAQELERALSGGAHVIGINNRDLDTLTTDLALAETLAGAVPKDRVVVAESGIGSAADVARLGTAGIDAILVGESLMRAEDPGVAAAALTGCARRSR